MLHEVSPRVSLARNDNVKPVIPVKMGARFLETSLMMNTRLKVNGTVRETTLSSAGMTIPYDR